MKIVRANLVSHTWVNCLDCTYQSLDPLSNGWIFADNALQPVWYDGRRYLVKNKFKVMSHKKVSC